MAKRNLASMSVDALLKLRGDLDAVLRQRANELNLQLSRLSRDVVGKQRGRRASSMRGRKVAPKYRDPATGETWAGRGARPRWLVARLKTGKKPQDFLIEKKARKAKRRKK
jgi:DNA-binding protein H-NS